MIYGDCNYIDKYNSLVYNIYKNPISYIFDGFFKDIHKLIDYDKSLYHCYTNDSQKRPFNFGSVDIPKHNIELYENYYINLDFCSWITMQPTAKVILDTDVLSDNKIVNTAFYNEWLKPMNVFYGVVCSVAYIGILYCCIAFFRSRNKGDFTEQDVNILRLLNRHISLRFSQIYPDGLQLYDFSYKDNALSKKYKLTQKETELVDKINAGVPRHQLAEKLFIAENTLKKHLTNIYYKTGTSNFSELEYLILSSV